MICRKRLVEGLSEDDGVLMLEGLDDALIGFSRRCSEPIAAVYDRKKMIAVLATRDGMTEEAADKSIDADISGACVGPGTPVVMFPCDSDWRVPDRRLVWLRIAS